MSNFMKIGRGRTDGRTDRQTCRSFIAAFRNFAKVPRKWWTATREINRDWNALCRRRSENVPGKYSLEFQLAIAHRSHTESPVPKIRFS